MGLQPKPSATLYSRGQEGLLAVCQVTSGPDLMGQVSKDLMRLQSNFIKVLGHNPCLLHFCAQRGLALASGMLLAEHTSLQLQERERKKPRTDIACGDLENFCPDSFPQGLASPRL